jgi:DHA3 family tetracycline resistance protein-like MFS transporter
MHPTRAYVLYNLLSGLAGSTMIAAYVPLLLSIGMSLSEVALLNVVFWTTIVILEIPTGMLADGKSRRFSVSCGVAAVALGFGLYSVVRGFWTAAVAEFLVGIGNAFISGAISAWLADALDRRGEKNKSRHALATGSLVSSLAMVVSGFACAFYLAPAHPRLCWALGAILSVGVFLCVRFAMTDDGEPVHRVSELEACRESFRVLKRKANLIWAASAATCMGLVIPFNLYWVPLVKEKAGSSGVAWAWVPMYGAMALAGYAVRRSKAKAGRETGMIATALLLSGIGLAFLWSFAGFAPLLGLIVLHEFGRGLFAPLLDAYTQQHIEAHYRATYGSLQSFIGKIGYAIVLGAVTLFIWGRPTTGSVITAVLGVAGAGLVISAVLLWFFRPKGAPP